MAIIYYLTKDYFLHTKIIVYTLLAKKKHKLQHFCGFNVTAVTVATFL